MKLNPLVSIVLILLSMSCNRIANKTKEGINKGGEMVGETATEFFDGVSEGVDKTLECEIILSKKLISNGLKTGIYDIEGQPFGNNNKLTLYLIFNKDFSKTLIAKAYNKNGLEIGRARSTVTAKKGDAGYYDFEFDDRTDIGYRNRITID